MIERVLETIGGVVTIIAGLVDIVLTHPLDYYLYKFNALSQYGNLFFSVKNEMNKIHKKSKE